MPWQHARGLMFRRKERAVAYIFVFKKPVQHAFHTWFVFARMHLALFEQKKGKYVLTEQQTMRPFSAIKPTQPYRFAVEWWDDAES